MRKLLDAPGTVLLLFVALQFLTGFVMALHYSPSVATAWASVVFLEERIQGGRFIRGLHAWGASAIVLLLVVHFVRTAWTGAYRKPRQLTWGLGLGLALVVFVFAHTGYLLPWDQKGYWATKVATGIAGATPVVGSTLQRVAVGGEDYGNLTLTRFYAVHVILLPATLVFLLAAHLWAHRKNRPPVDPAARLVHLAAFVAIALGFAAFVHHAGGAPLEAPADPTGGFEPRPEWYFLPLYQLLKFFPGRLEFVGSEVIPGAVFLVLLALPWIDRSGDAGARKRLPVLALAFAPFLVALLFGFLSVNEDANSAELKEHRKQEAADARLARTLFRENGGVPPEGPLALMDHYPPRLGQRLFKERCASCHALDGSPAGKGPDLTGYLSRRWLVDVIRDPGDKRLFGQGEFKESMGACDAKPDELAAMAAFVQSLESPGQASSEVQRGAKLFEDQQCSCCHSCKATPAARTGGRGSSSSGDEGPNLVGYGSEEWLVSFMRRPGDGRFYGKANKMPAFEDKLTQEELHALAVFMRALRDPPKED
jgi:ubiquinol-cytochrome c reductase cytochrome b subunit